MPALFDAPASLPGWVLHIERRMPPPRVAQVTVPLTTYSAGAVLQGLVVPVTRSDEPFRPTFSRVTPIRCKWRTVAHCAERIQYRLGMWDLPSSQRPKSPMPPQHAAGSLEGTHPAQWTNGLLRNSAALGGVATAAGSSLLHVSRRWPALIHLLRRCLPAG